MSALNDPAATALLLPLLDGAIEWPGHALFLNARASRSWPQAWRDTTHCVQWFKPQADALAAAGFTAIGSGHSIPAPLVLLLPPRQRDGSRALLVEALQACAPNGQVIAAVANDEGAKACETDLRALVGEVRVVSKHKCRVFSCSPSIRDRERAAHWQAKGQPFQRDDGLWSQAGVFSADGIDPATALLLRALPATLHGHVADLGAGIGVIACHLDAHAKEMTSLDLYEADARALELARRNLENARCTTRFHWHDVCTGVPGQYDAVVMNPPFHSMSKHGQPDIGRRFIEVAADALRRDGELWLVANAHLPYEETLTRRFARMHTVTQTQRFKVVQAAGPRR